MRFTYRELLLLDDLVTRYATVLDDELESLGNMPPIFARAARRDWQRRCRLHATLQAKITTAIQHRQARMTPEQIRRQALF
ncbi:hypothetical protein SAMN00768000_3593 [Sulfobacillus thermosulfidooxidans DSM 9293]|uniref:Uncharacterized protein n=1 Tax=Sulfobacillus thermosulfidooxidans (strain DSM 9293 / VKM B-1269 / AT-1) TaxID=929705 RepID=A0A1W1WP78_SULTA|nr:hypothetical protein [Sulfobacillus thermosulfidooxidans]SMC08012.1 hypothetical protein SAMN00768000_3593 [Sulfobacillus thermosulfidooxidans DSM 9293]